MLIKRRFANMRNTSCKRNAIFLHKRPTKLKPIQMGPNLVQTSAEPNLFDYTEYSR